MSYVPYRSPPTAGLRSWVPPICVSGLLWWFSANTISTREWVMATILLWFPWYAYCRWQRAGATIVPLFSLLALAYWAAFAMPLFLAVRPTDPITGDPFPEAIVYGSVAMGVLGVVAMGAGMRIPFRPINPAMLPDVADTPGSWRYLFCVMGFGTALSINEDWSLILGSGGHQLMDVLATSGPIGICAMLAARRITDTDSRSQRYALGIFVAARIVIGIASGWLGSVAFMGVILALIYLSKYRRLPTKAILIVIPVVLFLQAGKQTFRERYWTGGKTGGVIEKARYWLEASRDQWGSVFERNNVGGSHALFAKTVDRVALLPQVANVYAKTPGAVPYQYGSSYSYLAATLIPRAVWPGKPSVNDANRFYQVTYGLTAKDDLGGVSIAVGCLAESFMNFGWWGVAGIMFLIGLLLGFYERTLLAPESGLLFCGLGLGLLSGLLAVESQAAQYLGGLLQQIALFFLVALPVVRRRKRSQIHQPEPA